jgi:hypothetical protein
MFFQEDMNIDSPATAVAEYCIALDEIGITELQKVLQKPLLTTETANIKRIVRVLSYQMRQTISRRAVANLQIDSDDKSIS